MLYQGLPPLRCNSLKSLINQFLNFSQCKSLNRHYKTKTLSNLFHTFCCSFLHVLSLDSRPSLLDLTHSGQLAILLLRDLSLLYKVYYCYICSISYTFPPSHFIGSISWRSLRSFDNIPKIFLQRFIWIRYTYKSHMYNCSVYSYKVSHLCCLTTPSVVLFATFASVAPPNGDYNNQ